MPIERWNGTRYETVDLPRYGASTTPLGGLVWADGRWRRVMLRPPQPDAVAHAATGPHSVTRNTAVTYRTITVSSSIGNANGPMRLAVSWAWAAATSSTHTREIRVNVNGVQAAFWTWSGTNAGWVSSGTVDLGVKVGDVITVIGWATSATTAARNMTSLGTELTRLPYVNPRPEATLWSHFTSSSSHQAGIERPNITTVSGTPEWRLGTLRLPTVAQVKIPGLTVATVAAGFSYSFWMRTMSNATGWRTVLWQHPTGNTTPEAYIVHNMTSATAGVLVTGLRMGAKITEYTHPTTYPWNTWIHVTVNWVRTTTTAWTRELYVNGVLVASNNGTGFPTTPQPVGYPIDLGSADWYGDFDDFGFWDRPLTHAEVLALYNMKDPLDLPTT